MITPSDKGRRASWERQTSSGGRARATAHAIESSGAQHALDASLPKSRFNIDTGIEARRGGVRLRFLSTPAQQSLAEAVLAALSGARRRRMTYAVVDGHSRLGCSALHPDEQLTSSHPSACIYLNKVCRRRDRQRGAAGQPVLRGRAAPAGARRGVRRAAGGAAGSRQAAFRQLHAHPLPGNALLWS